jgi:1,4-dihydroxy-2-naphthoate octaprenyltransferase
MWGVFLAALLVGTYLTAVAGPVIVIIGLASIASAIAYTGGPYPLGYHGLGDVFVMLFFGFVAVCGTAFVQAGFVPQLAIWASVPVGSIATAVLVVNNVRDRETDVKAGKRTLPVRFGRGAGLCEYAVLSAFAYAVPVVLFAVGLATAWVLLPAVTLPIAVRLNRALFSGVGRALNATLVGTAKLLLFFGLLFAVGLGLGGGSP